MHVKRYVTRRSVLLFAAMAGLFAALAVWFGPAHPPNLLLITLDTTRADHLGCYGYTAGRTPVLDALAASGVLCERAYTVAPLTLPAHASLFTGLYPAETGVRTNGRGRLADALPTLAEVLHRQHYDTAAFAASFVLDGKFGLGRGFDLYDDDFGGDNPDADALHRCRNGASVVDAALRWLGARRSAPFFCWVHLYDPHAPYLAHRELFGSEFAERPYDAEIAYVDQQVGRLVEYLKVRRLDDQTLVVVVGDHGEGLGEHSERAHGSTLYNATMHVPLIFRQPTRLPAGRRMTSNVSLVDVSPTILELLGLADPQKITGSSFRQALIDGAGPEPPCYGATDEPFLANGWSPLRSLTEGDWKYIRTTEVELYNLASDPGERDNLADTEPEKTQAMESRLAGFESRLSSRAESQVRLSSSERRVLASLGYVGGASGTVTANASGSLPDIKAMLPFDVAVAEAQKQIKEGAVDAGIERLREIIERAPTHSAAYFLLGDALLDKSEFDEAKKVFYSLLAARPNAHEGHSRLAQVYIAQGKLEQAIGELSKAVEIDSDFAEGHYALGTALFNAGQPETALHHLRAALAIDPKYAAAYLARGNVLANLGRVTRAKANWRNALKYSPNSAEAHHNLGIVLADHGDAEEAHQHLARAAELRPESAELEYDLGAFLMRRGDYQEALAALTRALELRPGYAAAEDRLQEARRGLAGRKPLAD